MSEIENQSPALAWVAAALAMPQFFNQEMQKHVATVNEAAKRTIVEIDK